MAVDDGQLERIIVATQAMQADLEADVQRFDGAELSGPLVAQMFGILGGTVAALAHAVELLAKEVQKS